MSMKEMKQKEANATAARFIMCIPGMKRQAAVVMEKKSYIPMREARAREAPAIRQFTIVMVIPVMQKEAITAPAPPTPNFIRMTAEPCMTGMETDTGATVLRRMIVVDTAILPAEEGEASRVIAFPAV